MTSSRHWPSMGRAVGIWILLSAIGIAVVAVEDSGDPLVVLSDEHGPSAWDLVGVVLLLLGWGWFLLALWHARRDIPHPVVLGTCALAGLVVMSWSVLGDHGMWWAIGASAAATAQLLAGVGAARQQRGAPRDHS